MIGIIRVGIVVESGIAEDLQLQSHSSHFSFVDCHATGWVGCWVFGVGRWVVGIGTAGVVGSNSRESVLREIPQSHQGKVTIRKAV